MQQVMKGWALMVRASKCLLHALVSSRLSSALSPTMHEAGLICYELSDR